METPFDKLRHEYSDASEYWSARELYKLLGYSSWAGFTRAIEKAEIACQNSGYLVDDHFYYVKKVTVTKTGRKRSNLDVHLSRYACYLVIENADPAKPAVALGQTYFASAARKLELEAGRKLVSLHDELRLADTALSETVATNAGIMHSEDFSIFMDHGYSGLYGGETAADIRRRKGMVEGEDITEKMTRRELAVNLFRSTQAESAIEKAGRIDRENANQLHKRIGRMVRENIIDMGNEPPEKFPNPPESIPEIKRKLLESE